MAENKKSFILYSDNKSIIDMLSDEEAGLLLKTLFKYVNDENPIIDNSIKIVFEMIKLQLKRDLKKWESTKEGRSKAGKASAEARRLAKENEQNLTNLTNVDFVKQNSTNPTVNVNVSDSVNVNDINKGKNFVFYSELSNSESWIERVAMTNTQKYKPNEVKAKLKTFFDDCDVRGDVKINKTDFQSHFVRWLNQQVKPKETTKKPPLL